MNILYVPSWFPSRRKPYNGLYFLEQAKALSKLCDNLFIIYPQELEFNKKKFENEKNIHFFPFIKIHYKKTFFFYNFLDFYIKKILKKFGKIDIIHAQSFLWAGVNCAIISKKYNIPLIITEHHSRFILKKENTKIIRKIIETTEISSKIVFVSNFLKEGFIKNILKNNGYNHCSNLSDKDNYYLNKFSVIPNLVPDNFFVSLQEKSQELYKIIEKKFYEKFNIDKNKFIFCSISNLKRAKGYDLLIDVFYKAFNNSEIINKVLLLIGGEGAYRLAIENKIKNYKLENNIKLLGKLSREEVEYILEISNCFIYGSEYETFGIVIVEALAKGLPVITTDCGTSKEILNNFSGVIIENRNIERFSKELINSVEGKNNYDKKKIKDYAFCNFSETKFIENYKYLFYNEILKK